jgi:hypothetical protein
VEALRESLGDGRGVKRGWVRHPIVRAVLAICLVGGAIVQFWAGSNWAGVAILAFAAITSPLWSVKAVGRVCRRVRSEDEAPSPYTRMAIQFALLSALAFALGFAQLFGVGFPQDGGRGLLGLIGGGLFARLAVLAVRDGRRAARSVLDEGARVVIDATERTMELGVAGWHGTVVGRSYDEDNDRPDVVLGYAVAMARTMVVPGW